MPNKAPYSQQKEARQQNTAAVLRDLWRHAPLSQAMLAQRNGLTKTTVSAICADLAAMGLIRPAGKDRTGVGRPGNLIEFNASARYAIGVEISTNYSAAVVTDLCGQPLWERAELSQVGSDQATILNQAEALIHEAVAQAHQSGTPLLGIGVGVPGIVDPGPGRVVTAPALGWKEVPLKQIWEQRFSLPVVVENKARAAAMAEALRGSARLARSFVYVNIGTDVRSSVEAAVVADGFPYWGSRGMALDAGHMILEPDGPLCSCGQRGCWQIMADVDREVGLALPRLEAGEASVLQQLISDPDRVLEHRAIHQAAVELDPLALEVVRSIMMYHALGIANLVRLFDPEMVVIGYASLALPQTYKARMKRMGEMPEIGIKALAHGLLAHRSAPPPAIVDAAHGPEACMLGAAAVVVDEFLRTPPLVESQQPQV